MRFIEAYKAVLLHILADAKLRTTTSIHHNLISARTFASKHPGLLGKTIDAMEAAQEPLAPSVASAVRSMQVKQWIYLRQTTRYAVFLDTDTDNAFEVRALTDPLNAVAEAPPILVETGLFRYEGVVVCDGLLLNTIFLGRGYKASFDANYTRLRKAGRLYKTAEQFEQVFMPVQR
ncbi:hypothetical protein A7D16_10535 [Xanthomonas nasturtii]|uniref:Uncharacterized protein n=2 Tax=Xanthomonas nasturtii TaxID=1843581 RepID=A0A3E1KGB0_9XANT|nr:hypothetical protein [Xanthomonas nasturtii]MCL1500785.1 hypothetical protein [Xanthomonas nasturtii]MCL1522654.1 hypothetical protein [Xanthomonas nasturtii]MCL1531910.1 hypothetical protein [Xanthomonas nasturtii]MCL1534527.1 hypothetical protein [Xanthomonas nasturtii]MCL1551888.1 hypothetical protein [Xanthomonas nasturtii]